MPPERASYNSEVPKFNSLMTGKNLQINSFSYIFNPESGSDTDRYGYENSEKICSDNRFRWSLCPTAICKSLF